MEATRSNHTVYNCPRYRHSFLDHVEDTLESEFHAIIERNDYELQSLHISPDHVHVFLGGSKHSPSEIVSRLKSVTARRLWADHPEAMRS